jgi:AcrR family transcriptional regulator
VTQIDSKMPKTARRTQAERRAVAERELLAAAFKLVAEKGISGTTLADIGEAAGYSRALPAVYFGDKNGLVQALWQRASNLFRERFTLARQREKGLESVLGFIEVYLTRSSDDSHIFRATQILLTEAFTSTPEIRESVAEHNRTSEEFLRSHIRLGIRNGEIRDDVDPGPQAIMIIGALRAAVSHWMIDPKTSLTSQRKEFLRSVRRSLSA